MLESAGEHVHDPREANGMANTRADVEQGINDLLVPREDTTIRDTDFLDPRHVLEQLSRNTEQLDHLKVLSLESSRQRWGTVRTDADFERAQSEWVGLMDSWAQRLKDENPDIYDQVVNVVAYLTDMAAPDVKEHGIDWNEFHRILHSGDSSSIQKYIGILKTMPGIKGNYEGMKKLARIFGDEAYHEMFEEQTGEEFQKSRSDQTNHAVIRQYEKGNITEAKRDRLLAKAKERAKGHASEGEGSSEYLVGSIKIDSRFTREQRQRIKETLRTIPPELLKKITEVYWMKPGSGGEHATAWFNSRIGFNGKMMEQPYRESDGPGVLYHEIMGHGLRDFVAKVDNGLADELRAVWSRLSANTIRKDSYARKYLDNDPKYAHVNYPREGIQAEVDEFWSNRMAEYWSKRATGKRIHIHTGYNSVFTADEQAHIDRVCDATYQIYLKAAQKKQKYDEERQKFDQMSFLGKLSATARGEKPRLAYWGKIPKAA